LYVWKEITSNPNSDKNSNHLLTYDIIKAVRKNIAAFAERITTPIFLHGEHLLKLTYLIFVNRFRSTIVQSFSDKRIPFGANLAVFKTWNNVSSTERHDFLEPEIYM
jgi:hypothetical protein